MAGGGHSTDRVKESIQRGNPGSAIISAIASGQIAGLACTWLMLAGLASGAVAAPPDAILHNGKIVTVDDTFSIAEAVAIADGRIVAVGVESDVRALAGERTRLTDLEGRTVLPGLIDTHTHPTGASMYEFDHPVPDMQTIADVLSYFRERAKVVPEGEWIRLQQVFITRLREQRYPTRAELDDAAPNHAAYFRTGPDASLNSLALELSGIDRDFRVPQGVLGRIERDSSGEPTGIIRSGAHLIRFRESQAIPTPGDRRSRLKELISDYNKVGLTGIADRNASPEGRGTVRGPARLGPIDRPGVSQLRDQRSRPAGRYRSYDLQACPSSQASLPPHAVAAGDQVLHGRGHADR